MPETQTSEATTKQVEISEIAVDSLQSYQQQRRGLVDGTIKLVQKAADGEPETNAGEETKGADDSSEKEEVGEKKADATPEGDGEGKEDGNPDNAGDDEKTFTQSEVDKVVKERLARERRKRDAEARVEAAKAKHAKSEVKPKKQEKPESVEHKPADADPMPDMDDYDGDWDKFSDDFEAWEKRQEGGDAGSAAETNKSDDEGTEKPDGETAKSDDSEGDVDPQVHADVTERLSLLESVADAEDPELYAKFHEEVYVRKNLDMTFPMLEYITDNPEQGVKIIAEFVERPSKARDIMALDSPFAQKQELKALYQELDSANAEPAEEGKPKRQAKKIPDIKPLRGSGAGKPPSTLGEAADSGSLADYAALRQKQQEKKR